MDQCSILFVNPRRRRVRQLESLRRLGFLVSEAEDLPPTAELVAHHVVVVLTEARHALPVLGTHLRAKPQFGRRALIALVPPDTSTRARREAVDCGFDATLPATVGGRALAVTMLRALRPHPEHRCILPPLMRSRRAA